MQEQPQILHRDGASQANRVQRALDPGYVSVDERSIRDLLAFAREYAKKLRYFNERNEQAGDWTHFLGDNDDDLDEIVAFLNDPQRFQADPKLLRPHLVLFLTFLELLQYARVHLNDLTRRHLEFYYREALRLTSQKGLPDQVHTLVELAKGQEKSCLPAGALFRAGQDSLGNDLFYRSDNDLIANRAGVESLKSLFIERTVIGIKEARKDPDLLIELFPDNKDVFEKDARQTDRSFTAMLMMALGTPGPGRKLEEYPGKHPVDTALLEELDTLLGFIPSALYMPISTFRSLMQLKQTQTDEQWAPVNAALEAAAKSRLKNPKFKLDLSEPANFEKNLLAALSLIDFNKIFDELPDVENIYDVYRRRKMKDPSSYPDYLVVFIQNSLYMSVEDFNAMMKIVEEINDRWRQIYEVLRAASRKKQQIDKKHKLQSSQIRKYDADKFNTLVQDTLGQLHQDQFISSEKAFDDYFARIETLENYFHITAEEFAFVRAINAKQDEAQPWEWEHVYAILEAAHVEKVLEKALPDRRNALKTKRETAGFQAMLLFALGDPNPGDALPDSEKFELLDKDKDKDYIRDKLFLEAENFRQIKDIESKGDKATPEEWERVYAILEQAQRRKRGLPGMRAEIEKWDNLYAAADATQVRLDAGSETSTPCWSTFGAGRGQAGVAPASIGFAIASPLLALAEGTRVITLTLAFQENGFDKAGIDLAIQKPYPFRFLLSSEKEMLPVTDENVEMKMIDLPVAQKPSLPALGITLTLKEQAPAVAPLTVKALIQTPWPVLQIMLADIPASLASPTPLASPHFGVQNGGNEEGEESVKRYRIFQSLVLQKVRLEVDVKGITKLTLQNDNSLLDSKKPFEPFGMSPVVGSSFYIAHPELCSKPLDELRLSIDWLGAPEDFKTYYRGYARFAERTIDPTKDSTNDPNKDPANNQTTSPDKIVDHTSFSAGLKLYDNRSSVPVGNLQLFKDANADANLLTITAAIKRDYLLQPVIAQEVLDWPRYWQLELLAPDFQHAIYPQAAAGCANKVDMSTPPKPQPYIINPPYTPKIKRLSMGYTAALEIDLSSPHFGIQNGGNVGGQVDKLYHIEPFGYHELAASILEGNGGTGMAFLPQYENEGELYIGIKNLAPPQNLSLLFQVAKGCADPDMAREAIHWSFLDGNVWKSLDEEGRLLSDGTNGLLNSGIITFNLPPVGAVTLLPADLYWLRAAIANNSRSIGDMVAIKAQAVSATFVDHGNAPNHLSQPLKAGSITGLAEKQPAVKSIGQPYSSFGGKSQEEAGSFYTRVSERLRHKNRALTCWDYEHMVLDAFPGIFKVKCLPAGVSKDPRLVDVIQVIVIPDIRGKLPFDPLEPKSPADLLFQIKQYLLGHCAPFARFEVKNPTYLRLRVRLGVRLRPGYNPGFCQKTLSDELMGYLAPWAYDPDRSAEIVFGGQIKPSLIVNFVEERPYVDYVAGVKLFIISPDGRDVKPYNPTAEAPAFAPDAILVPDTSHQIDLIPDEGYEEEYFTGINYMKIEFDFQIA